MLPTSFNVISLLKATICSYSKFGFRFLPLLQQRLKMMTFICTCSTLVHDISTTTEPVLPARLIENVLSTFTFPWGWTLSIMTFFSGQHVNFSHKVAMRNYELTEIKKIKGLPHCVYIQSLKIRLKAQRNERRRHKQFKTGYVRTMTMLTCWS